MNATQDRLLDRWIRSKNSACWMFSVLCGRIGASICLAFALGARPPLVPASMPGPDDSMPASATLTVSRERLGSNVGLNGMPSSATLTVSRDRVEKIEMCLLALAGYVRGMLNADAADAGAIPGPNPSTRDRSCSRSPHRRGGLVAQSSDPSLSTSAAAGRPSSASLAVTSPPTSSASLPAARPTSSASLARVDDPDPVPCFYASSYRDGSTCELIGKTQVRMTAPTGFVASPQYRICCHECTNWLLNTDSAVIAERDR